MVTWILSETVSENGQKYCLHWQLNLTETSNSLCLKLHKRCQLIADLVNRMLTRASISPLLGCACKRLLLTLVVLLTSSNEDLYDRAETRSVALFLHRLLIAAS